MVLDTSIVSPRFFALQMQKDLTHGKLSFFLKDIDKTKLISFHIDILKYNILNVWTLSH